ncbi:MAG: ferredoxin family protein [Acidimicrobiia bacterium]|nr:ferredoxin family protein [Acidimicrobiia bacterium]MXZ86715.1 ferredoxin family protein [Acidimicrobiia bacterium]MYG71201.1 ferredoxin family protein [Acidimicrobiia bacterium]MYJ62868.1 ferredoxin family protein [Acidimicrobiia bacterium]
MTYVIGPPCIDVKDAACVAECPVDCIYTGGRMLYIQPDECIDCGACEPVCPVEAIYPESFLPTDFQAFTEVNADFFEIVGLGAPGGAAHVEAVEADHPLVGGWPPRSPPPEAPSSVAP